MAENCFLQDIRSARASADALLGTAAAGPQKSVELLQTLLAAEIVCIRRYTGLAVSPLGLKYVSIGTEFQEQANDERRHMILLAERIAELGGVPDYAPHGLIAKHYVSDDTEARLAEIVRDNLLAERSVVEQYRQLIGYFGKFDHKTCAVLKFVLQDEEHHMADMHDLIAADAGQGKSFLN